MNNPNFNEILSEALAKFNRKTNADRIRSMSDKELAYWYFNEFFRKTPYCRKEECYEDTPCEECLLDWLKEEVVDGV